jgi:hypothetical protein
MQEIEPRRSKASGEVLRQRESGHGLEDHENADSGSMLLGSPWEESCKSFRFGMAREGEGTLRIG